MKGDGALRLIFLMQLVALCSVFVCFSLCGQATVLHTIFHHHVKVQPESQEGSGNFLEIGKLILCFDDDPELEVLTPRARENSTHVERTFFCRHTAVKSDACVKMLHDVVKNQSTWYALDVIQVQSPMEGVRITVAYDRSRVGLIYDVLDMGNKKRLVFTFYSKKCLKEMSEAMVPGLSQVNSGRRGIIIDCGHGGSDQGAVSASGLCEKDVNLDVGLCLSHLLERRGFDVFLTRNSDQALAYEERTCISEHNKHAHVFLSIHTNSAPSSYASGIETFFFDAHSLPASQPRSRLLGKLMQVRTQKSQLLADCVQQGVLEYVRSKYQGVADRRAKHAFLQVLIGSPLPAVLVEIGFLTNALEESLLRDPSYHMLLAMGMCEGIVRYFEQATD